jgi:hypothetical protein
MHNVRLAVAALIFTSASVAFATPELRTVLQPPQLPPDTVLTGETIYLNKCTGGCTVKPGSTDARTDTTALASMQASFTEYAWQPGEWTQVVQCVREVYSPFAVNVTDVRPNTEYSEAIVAGRPQDIGLPTGVGGVGPGSRDCSPMTNQVAFAFAETAVNDFAQEDNNNRVWGICWVISQEIAHAYGLPDHEIAFTDGESACSDPMTYLANCGGQKFFRNRTASCGDFAAKPCSCASVVNSHLKLTSVFGPGTSLVAAPTVTLDSPASGASVAKGFVTAPTAFSRRGVKHLDLFLNGHRWASAPGAKFSLSGQLKTTYALTAPANVPDGVIDVMVKAYDDLEIETDSSTVTVTKGAACATAATCLTGQKCEAGKCFWDPPTGVLGDVCTFNEFCTTGMCQASDIGQYCTQACVVGSTDGCPPSFDCVATSETGGVCLPQSTSSGGCCSVEHGSRNAPWAPLGLGAVALGLVLRRRRARTLVV